ncbi:MAG: TolC family protein [Bacteroidales bacterium]|nr:TolC family protein [Bacteroidales bacterium]
MKKITAIIISLMLVSDFIAAQTDTTFARTYIGFNEYLELVAAGNLGYAAEKFNIDISEAAIEQARVFNDPSLSFDYNYSEEGGIYTGFDISSGIETTIAISGKRRARIDLARSESLLIRAIVDDYFRNLRADAAIAYLEALREGHLIRVKSDSYQTLRQLSAADSIRFANGVIMEIDAIQSKVEAGFLLNELFEAEAAWRNALILLTQMTGRAEKNFTYFPSGSLQVLTREFDQAALAETAIENRSDLLAALNNKYVSQKLLQLVRKERVFDIDVRAAIENSYINPGSDLAANAITAGFSVPLKFSNLNKGEIKMSQLQLAQAEELYRMAELQVRTEIAIAYQNYKTTCQQADSFEKGLLEGARDVLKGKIYSYERGESSLLEVLNSQRTYNEIQSAYYETLFNRAAALVELERAAGIWDIEF